MDTKSKNDIMIIHGFTKFMRFGFSSFLLYKQKLPAFFKSDIPTYHEYAQAYFCISGEYAHTVDEDTYKCTAGDVVIIPPGSFNSISVSERGAEIINLIISIDAYLDKDIGKYISTICATHLFAFSKELGFFPLIHTSLSQASFKICREALLLLSEKGIAMQRKYDCVEKMFSCPEFCISEQRKTRAKKVSEKYLLPVLHAMVYISKNYPQRITSEKLCEVSYLCRTNLFAFFKRYLGISYTHYLLMMRIRNASLLIINTSYSIAYISDKCGFSDVSHMSKWYKKYRHELPHEERARQPQILSEQRKLALTHDFWDEL
ncbi:MAG: AraC family transcriptional regulator [Ruminococcaceae bacterium]|nr:AraC family transcriptional regulator [Oscillospiraceae bacterium]